MPERRRSERIKCRFDCELLGGGRPIGGTVVDISSGGLAVRTEGDVQQGDSLIVRMTVPGHGKLEIEALVWHVRRGRRRDTGTPIQFLGMILAKAPKEFLKLLPEGRPGERVVIEEQEGLKDEKPKRPSTIAKAVALTPHRVRLKHLSTPRTRVVCVDATSTREACAIAARELGGEWAVLEALGGAAK